MIATFVATTQLPLQQAIVADALLSLLLYCAQSARQGHIEGLSRDERGQWSVVPVPAELPPGRVTAVNYRGVNFFAELPTLQHELPDPAGARNAVLILAVRSAADLPSFGDCHHHPPLSPTIGAGWRTAHPRRCEPRYPGTVADTGIADTIGHGNIIPAEPSSSAPLTRPSSSDETGSRQWKRAPKGETGRDGLERNRIARKARLRRCCRSVISTPDTDAGVCAMERLSGLDASFLYYETPAHHMHVCSVTFLDTSTTPGGYDYARFREGLRRKALNTSLLRRMPHDPLLNLDHPVWVEVDDLTIDDHVHRVELGADSTTDDLADLCGEIAATQLERTRPLWEMWVIEGLPEPRIAVLIKMHHSAIDGVGAMNLMSALCQLTPEDPAIAGDREDERPARPSDLDIAADAVGQVLRRPWRLAELVPKTAALLGSSIGRLRSGTAMPPPFVAPRTSFNTTITARRSVAFTQFDLAEVKEIKNAFGGTVNDVLLAVCSGALRSYLIKRDELPTQPLVAMVPLSMHDAETPVASTNKVSGMFCALASDVDDPVERLNAIAAGNRAAKDHHAIVPADLLVSWAQFAPPAGGLAVRAYHRLRLADTHPVVHNLIISNVAGPPVPLYFLGARVLGLHPFGPIFDGAGLNITAISLDGKVNLGLLACPDLIPDVWQLADAMDSAFRELLNRAV